MDDDEIDDGARGTVVAVRRDELPGPSDPTRDRIDLWKFAAATGCRISPHPRIMPPRAPGVIRRPQSGTRARANPLARASPLECVAMQTQPDRSSNAPLAARDLRVVWHPCTQMKDHESLPMIPIARGSGVWLYDHEGRRYLDAISSWWVNLFGHANPRIGAAVAAAARTARARDAGRLYP